MAIKVSKRMKAQLDASGVDYRMFISGSKERYQVIGTDAIYEYRDSVFENKSLMYVFRHVKNNALSIMDDMDKKVKRPRFVHAGQFFENRDTGIVFSKDVSIYYVDIVAAYWTVAFYLGICDKKVYERFMFGEDEKLYRNASLGALAKISLLFEKRGGVFRLKDESREPTSHIFFTIASHIDNVIGNISNINGYMFSWVDAICVAGKSSAKTIIENAGDNGFKTGVKEVSKVVKLGNCYYIYFKGVKKPKKFTFPNNNKRVLISEARSNGHKKQKQ